jgi:predicted transcriptional regulator
MNALESIIKSSNLTPYAFAKKHRISNIYTVVKRENFNLKTIIDIARKENIVSFNFSMYNCDIEVILK